MAAPDLHRLILHPLHCTGIDYMITGSVAAIAYGEPRMTNDVDLVLRLGAGDGPTLAAAFSSTDYYIPPPEVIEDERLRPQHGHFNIIHHATALRADIYLVGDDELHVWAMKRRHAAHVAGDDLWFAPLEYVIVRKLEYFAGSGSDRHLRDIAGMLRVSADRVDHAEVERLVGARNLDAVWQQAKTLAYS